MASIQTYTQYYMLFFLYHRNMPPNAAAPSTPQAAGTKRAASSPLPPSSAATSPSVLSLPTTPLSLPPMHPACYQNMPAALHTALDNMPIDDIVTFQPSTPVRQLIIETVQWMWMLHQAGQEAAQELSAPADIDMLFHAMMCCQPWWHDMWRAAGLSPP